MVTPLLPEPTINSPEVDAGSIEFFEQNPSVDMGEALSLCKQDALDKVSQSTEIKSYATANLQKTVEALMNPLLSDKGYTISWAPAASSQDSGDDTKDAEPAAAEQQQEENNDAQMSSRITAGLLVLTLATSGTLIGCQAEITKATPNFSGYESIAELSTIECYYHNVAKFSRDADSGVFGFMNHGYKKAWFEYSGVVRMRIDAYKVTISQPDENNVVTVSMPYARLIGDPDVDENSMTEPLVETGWWTELTAEDKLAMFSEAQQKMREAAESDDALLAQARTRAKDILEQYVKNVGEQIGEDYTVAFVDAS